MSKSFAVKLYEDANAENEKWLSELRKKTPDQIIEKAYEYVIRTEILALLEEKAYIPDRAMAWLKKMPSDRRLAALYNCWCDGDININSLLEDMLGSLDQFIKA